MASPDKISLSQKRLEVIEVLDYLFGRTTGKNINYPSFDNTDDRVKSLASTLDVEQFCPVTISFLYDFNERYADAENVTQSIEYIYDRSRVNIMLICEHFKNIGTLDCVTSDLIINLIANGIIPLGYSNLVASYDELKGNRIGDHELKLIGWMKGLEKNRATVIWLSEWLTNKSLYKQWRSEYCRVNRFDLKSEHASQMWRDYLLICLYLILVHFIFNSVL